MRSRPHPVIRPTGVLAPLLSSYTTHSLPLYYPLKQNHPPNQNQSSFLSIKFHLLHFFLFFFNIYIFFCSFISSPLSPFAFSFHKCILRTTKLRTYHRETNDNRPHRLTCTSPVLHTRVKPRLRRRGLPLRHPAPPEAGNTPFTMGSDPETGNG